MCVEDPCSQIPSHMYPWSYVAHVTTGYSNCCTRFPSNIWCSPALCELWLCMLLSITWSKLSSYSTLVVLPVFTFRMIFASTLEWLHWSPTASDTYHSCYQSLYLLCYIQQKSMFVCVCVDLCVYVCVCVCVCVCVLCVCVCVCVCLFKCVCVLCLCVFKCVCCVCVCTCVCACLCVCM